MQLMARLFCVRGGVLLFLALLMGAPLPAAELNVPETVIFEKGIEYSNPEGQHLQLDLARPKSQTAPGPAVLCIHGGGFRAGKRDSYDALCIRLAERGYVAATVTYRLAPQFPFPAA